MKLIERIRQEVFENHAIEEYRIYVRKTAKRRGKRFAYRVPAGFMSCQDVTNLIPYWNPA